MKLCLSIGTENDQQQVHAASLKILNDVGCRFQNEKARHCLKKHGAKVEGEIVFIPSALVEKALKTTPSSFRWRARNDTFSLMIGDGKIKLAPNAGNVYVQDIDQGRRLAVIEDVRKIQTIHQASECTDFVGNNPCDPSDVEINKKHLYVTHEVLKHTNKPFVSYFAPYKDQSKEILHMVALAFGEEDVLRQHYIVGTSVSSTSPLIYTQETLDVITTFAAYNQPVMLSTIVMGGITGPLNLMGIAIQQNAELLAGTTYIQALNPGNPVVWSPSSTIAWLKSASYCTGTPEAMLPNIFSLQMAKHYYKIPTRNMAGLTDSKLVDSQAGYETMQNLMLAMLGGAEIAYEALGVLDNIMTTSYEKIILDEEMFQRVSRINRGIDSSAIEESLALIKEIGCGGDFLTHSNTLNHFRDMWKPTVSSWDNYSEWENAGSHDVAVRANKIWKARLNEAPASLIDSAVEKELKHFIELRQ